jgi:hypothetical protein
MKKLLITIFTVVLIPFTHAQSLVALHHNGVATFYNGVNGLVQAYAAAADGDTLYLPGGFLTSPWDFAKSLTVFGAGHYPDSTLATEKTIITSSISFSDNADNFHLEGVQINGDVLFGNNQSVNNVTIKRCRFNTIYYYGDYTNPCINNLIAQCVINGSFHAINAQSVLVSNNIIAGKLHDFNTNVVQNNVILSNYYSSYPYYSTQSFTNFNNSTIRNNVIFCSDVNAVGGVGNIVKNNVFAIDWDEGSNIASGNYESVDLSTFFVLQSGNVFDYTHNYQLTNSGLYLGEDGTQVGIYGNFLGYKEGAVPVNPHISTKMIAPQTDSNGEIQLQFQINAQDN